jgi:hypothetical protein
MIDRAGRQDGLDKEKERLGVSTRKRSEKNMARRGQNMVKKVMTSYDNYLHLNCVKSPSTASINFPNIL